LTDVLFSDSAGQVRAAAAEALGVIQDARAVSALATASQSTDADVARVAIDALGRIPGAAALTPLAATVHRREAPRSHWAAQSLGARRQADAVPTLTEAATQAADAALSASAVAALGRISTVESVNALLSLAAEKRLRPACVDALSQAGETQIAPLARGILNENISVSTAAIEALARMKRPGASEKIAAALNDPRPEVRLLAVNSLKRLGNRSFRVDVERVARHDGDPAVAAAARRASRRRRNRCTACGYSRAGLAGAAACPECGSPCDR
jgi:HEAT repeat protein